MIYRCINHHEVDHGINKADDEGLRCPECGDHLIFSIKEISPTVIKIKALENIYYSDGWDEAQGLDVNFGFSLSVFDRPEEFTLMKKWNMFSNIPVTFHPKLHGISP